MLKRGDNSILIDSVSDIVCGGLHIVGGIAHRDTDPGIFNDRDVVASVAERHALLACHADALKDARRAVGF